jgi:hypothetical protein
MPPISKRRCQRGHDQRQHQRRQQQQAINAAFDQDGEHRRRVEYGPPVDAESVAQQLRAARPHPAGQRIHAGHAGHGHQEGAQFARVGYLPFLAGFLEPSL